MLRDPQGIIAAHKMDPRRRELYVEGRRDRLFFLWLLGDKRDPNAMVHEIEFVGMCPATQGGCRTKLLALAQIMVNKSAKIRCFADADFDRVLRRSQPANVTLTDHRDLEGYFLQPPCLEKVLKLAIASETLRSTHLLNEVHSKGRQLGILRLLSEKRGLKLPFQQAHLERHLKKNGFTVDLNLDAYMQSLLQGANISLRELPRIKHEMTELADSLSSVPNSELVHGKDSITILRVLLKSKTFKGEAVEPSLWASLDHNTLKGLPSLEAMKKFLMRLPLNRADRRQEAEAPREPGHSDG